MNIAQQLLLSLGYEPQLLVQHHVNTVIRYSSKRKRQHPNKKIRGAQRKMQAAWKKEKENA
jgi:hypothetical protein